jgi:hypothetical protein
MSKGPIILREEITVSIVRDGRRVTHTIRGQLNEQWRKRRVGRVEVQPCQSLTLAYTLVPTGSTEGYAVQYEDDPSYCRVEFPVQLMYPELEGLTRIIPDHADDKMCWRTEARLFQSGRMQVVNRHMVDLLKLARGR